jgi:hypothetical protein
MNLNKNDFFLLAFKFQAESLTEKLNKTKEKRMEFEAMRDDLIKKLKLIHSRITLRRKEGSSHLISS